MGLRIVKPKRNPFRMGGPGAAVASLDASTITVGAEASNVIQVTVQLRTADGKNMTKAVPVTAWLSDSATTGAIVGTAPSGGVAAGVGSVLAAVVAGKYLECVTNATGALRLDITEAAAKTEYLYVKFPDGRVRTSGAITHA